MTTENNLIVIETASSQLILGTGRNNQLLQYYYGSKLENPADVIIPDNANTVQQGFPAITSSPENEKGEEAPLAYPCFGAWNNNGGCRISHADGNMSLEMVYGSHTTETIDSNCSLTTVELKDTFYPLTIKLNYKSHKAEDVIETWVEFSHSEEAPVVLHSYPSVQLTFNNRYSDFHLSYLQGLWEREHSLVEEKLNYGSKVLENRFGTWSSFGYNPSFMLSLNGASTEESGEVVAGSLAWSGAWKNSFDLNHGPLFHDKGVRSSLSVVSGQNDFAAEYTLDADTVFTTATFIFTRSDNGKGDVSRNLHRWGRKNALRDGNSERPILLNSWEGAYFDFDEDCLLSMMDGVAKMGAEMFVLDDGWFGRGDCARNDADAGLGDWMVNEEKLPRGLSFLVDEATNRGLKFGIWVEPEMVNPKSELYAAHPDWIMQQPNREKIVYRTQFILDLANPAVQEHVFESVANVLRENPGIAYVKWDCNRSFMNVGSTYLGADRQSHIWNDYVEGLYGVYAKLSAEFPNTMFQACASGGGRIDYGILPYNHEFWTSDNTDALQRVFIQWGTNHFFPAIASASHVTITPNHQTGRSIPLKFRFDVAMSGRLGLELNPNDMDSAELDFVQTAVKTYKDIRPVVSFGDLYRLKSPYDGEYAAINYVSEDRDRAILFAYKHIHYLGLEMPQIKLQGLDADKMYQLTEINVEEGRVHSQSNGKTISGQSLMQYGIRVHLSKEYDSAVFELKAV